MVRDILEHNVVVCGRHGEGGSHDAEECCSRGKLIVQKGGRFRR